MFKLDPNLVYKLPPVRELPTLDAQAVPEDWLGALINLTKQSLAPQPGVDFAQRIGEHVGSAATYNMKQQVLEALQVIYSVMVDPSTTGDSRAAIAFKLFERAKLCTPGFHDGVNAILEGFVRPQSMDELLYRVRRDLVSKTANQLTDDVHANNRVFTVAQIAGLGVRSLNPNDVHLGVVSDAAIHDKLKHAFNEEYTLFKIMSHLAEEVNSELITLGYTSETIAQDKLETCIAFLTDVFKDSPAVVRHHQAVKQVDDLRARYTQRINDFKALNREYLQRLRIALRPELMYALITNDAKMPESMLDKVLSRVSQENKDVINRIQHQYRQLLESEDMRHLAVQMNEAKQDSASPFALKAEDEDAGVRLNWPQIQTAIWHVFRDQDYVKLDPENKRLLNGLLDSTEPFNLKDAKDLALSANDLLVVLTFGIVSDEKKEALILAYLDKTDEEIHCQFSTFQTINKMCEDGLSICAAIKESLQTVISDRATLLRKQWLNQCGIDLSNPIGNFSLTGHEPEYIRCYKPYVLLAVQRNGRALHYASAALKRDRDVVLVAVQRIGGALYYASAGLKGDKAVVLAAVRQDGYALEYASEALRGDKDIVLAAVKGLIEQGKVIPTQKMLDLAKRQDHTELVQCLTNAMSSRQAALIEPQDATEVREAQKSMKSTLQQQRGDDPLEPGDNHLFSL